MPGMSWTRVELRLRIAEFYHTTQKHADEMIEYQSESMQGSEHTYLSIWRSMQADYRIGRHMDHTPS
jgi:hypothetical protein